MAREAHTSSTHKLLRPEHNRLVEAAARRLEALLDRRVTVRFPAPMQAGLVSS